MNHPSLKNMIRLLALVSFISGLVFPNETQAQFFNFTRAIPQLDTNGVPLLNANTAFADGSVFQPAGNEARSTLWAWRPFGNDGVLSSLGPGTSTAPSGTKELVTCVTNLKAGTAYCVKVLFWNTSSGVWGVRAGLNCAGEMRTNTWFNTNSTAVLNADYLAWDNMPLIFSENGRTLYTGNLGMATANPNGVIKVFVHDLPTGDANRRTWYQGVAVAEVTGTTNPAPCIVDASATGIRFNRGV